MITGIGLDVVEISRIERVLDRQPRFPTRLLTKQELHAFLLLHGRRKVEYIAGRFAAKEAYAKATGLGIGGQLSFQEIEIHNTNSGKPLLRDLRNDDGAEIIHLSITHSQQLAAAQVIIEER